ncbi:hypothetical protein L1887_11598 [Cichorium endivia]|nr:hypothetical protein L1887_11598 [Cichorium endivia]
MLSDFGRGDWVHDWRLELANSDEESDTGGSQDSLLGFTPKSVGTPETSRTRKSAGGEEQLEQSSRGNLKSRGSFESLDDVENHLDLRLQARVFLILFERIEATLELGEKIGFQFTGDKEQYHAMLRNRGVASVSQ